MKGSAARTKFMLPAIGSIMVRTAGLEAEALVTVEREGVLHVHVGEDRDRVRAQRGAPAHQLIGAALDQPLVRDRGAREHVDAQEAALKVPVGNADGRILERPAKPLLTLAQRFLGLPEVGDVGAGTEPLGD